MPTPQPTLQLWMTLKQIPHTAPAQKTSDPRWTDFGWGRYKEVDMIWHHFHTQ